MQSSRRPASGAYTSLVSNLLFPLHEHLKKHTTVRDRQELEASQWWSRERIFEVQLAKLRSFLADIGEKVPYYSALFEELRFEPRHIYSIADLSRLPFLTKAVIRKHYERLRSRSAVGVERFNTGGSSGEPLVFLIGRERVSRDVAAKWRATRWWGVDIGDPEVVVWGSPIELGTQDRIRRIRDRLFRTSLLPAFEMSQEKLADFVAVIRGKCPKMLFGYPSALALIARFVEEQGERLDDLGIRVAFVTSECLYDHQRERIEHVFGCKVANGYGGRDAGFIAHQCPAGGMHITAEDVIVEIVHPDGNPCGEGESGEVVVTHLATRDFPFVRYRTGDIAVMSGDICGCGRGLPLLEEIQGRSTDFVMASDGTVMHGLSLIYVLRDVEGIDTFNIVQEDRENTRVRIVPDSRFDPESLAGIRDGLLQRLGRDVTLDIQLVDSIPPEPSGKFRYVVSRVAS